MKTSHVDGRLDTDSPVAVAIQLLRRAVGTCLCPCHVLIRFVPTKERPGVRSASGGCARIQLHVEAILRKRGGEYNCKPVVDSDLKFANGVNVVRVSSGCYSTPVGVDGGDR